jgi:hypothetical protein
VWVEDEVGTKVVSRNVPKTVEGLGESGRWLDERRAAGRELWLDPQPPDANRNARDPGAL